MAFKFYASVAGEKLVGESFFTHPLPSYQGNCLNNCLFKQVIVCLEGSYQKRNLSKQDLIFRLNLQLLKFVLRYA